MLEFTAPSVALLEAAAVIFLLRICDVSLGTLRLIMIAKGHRRPAAILGFFEVTIWILAVSQVLTGITNVWAVLGYSGGYAAGTSIGMLIESRFDLGKVEIRVLSQNKSEQVLEALKALDVRALQISAASAGQQLPTLLTIIPKNHAVGVLAAIRQADPGAYVVIEDVQRVIVPKIAR